MRLRWGHVQMGFLRQGFWYFARLQRRETQVNPWKFRWIRKLQQNLLEILSNTTTTYLKLFSAIGAVLNCCKLANLSWNFITTTSKQCPKTTRRKLCCKKLGTSRDVKSLPLANFSSALSVKYTLVKWVQNQSIFSKICPENSHKIGWFLPIVFRRI